MGTLARASPALAALFRPLLSPLAFSLLGSARRCLLPQGPVSAAAAKASGDGNATDESSGSLPAAGIHKSNVAADVKSNGKSDGLVAAPDPGGASIGGAPASKYAVGSGGEGESLS